jgi:hypothetical protein
MTNNIFNRTVKTNIILYPTDGTGRDCYITYNNAGFWKDNIKRITQKEKFGRKPFATFHSLKRIPPSWNYHADGTGRDGYVLYDCGGLIHRFRLPNTNLFRSDNDDNNMRNTSYKNCFLSRDERIYKQKLHQIQNDLLQRLYYKPQREIKFKFLHKDNSAPNIFNRKELEPIKNKSGKSFINNEQNNNENNNAYGRYTFNTLNRAFNNNTNTKSQLRTAFLDEKTNNDENSYQMNNDNKFRKLPKYRVKCLSNSIDERVYSYPFNQFRYQKK